jgi:hypothetical protein
MDQMPSEQESAQGPRPAPKIAPGVRPVIQIATLLRDEVTGELIVQVGPRRYQKVTEIDNDSDRRKIEYALADLTQWYGPISVTPRSTANVPSTTTSTPASISVESDDRPVSGGSMIDQINAIIDRKLEKAGMNAKGVRLVPESSGGLRVLVGIQSYPVDEVPDADARRIIREAVAEWEASQ